MDLNFVEILGYVASVLVAVSLLMNSIIKLRWINLIGAICFSAYGATIGSLPVAAVNGFIVFINIYYLLKIYTAKEYFKILQVTSKDVYLNEFLKFHAAEIMLFFPDFKLELLENAQCSLVLRNTSVAGVFIAVKNEDKLHVILDFVVPEYRDFKPGSFIYNKNADLFKKQGIKYVEANAFGKYHKNYLLKMNFKPMQNSDTVFIKEL